MKAVTVTVLFQGKGEYLHAIQQWSHSRENAVSPDTSGYVAVSFWICAVSLTFLVDGRTTTVYDLGSV